LEGERLQNGLSFEGSAQEKGNKPGGSFSEHGGERKETGQIRFLLVRPFRVGKKKNRVEKIRRERGGWGARLGGKTNHFGTKKKGEAHETIKKGGGTSHDISPPSLK